MSEFKVGSRVKRNTEGWRDVKVGETYLVKSFSVEDGLKLTDLQGNVVDGFYDDQFFDVITEVEQPTVFTKEHYAAAFNMWMDTYTNDPSAFESSYDTVMRHVSEKLNGEEPSYGVVCAELFQEYLNKTLEGK